MDNDNKETISRFNEGFNQIQRIGNAWTRCSYYSKNGQLDKWRWELEYISRELSTDEITFDKEEGRLKADKFVALAFKTTNRKLMYKSLDEKERLLRGLQEECGKGGSYDDREDDSAHW